MEEKQQRKRGPKNINFQKRGDKIKEDIDTLVSAILTEKKNLSNLPQPKKIKFSDFDLEQEDLTTLIEIQAKLSRIILERSKTKK